MELPGFVNQILLQNFKPLCHARSGAFILMQLRSFVPKCALQFRFVSPPSLQAVSIENPLLVAFISFACVLLYTKLS